MIMQSANEALEARRNSLRSRKARVIDEASGATADGFADCFSRRR